jgi:hypothetical protein
VLSSSPWRRLLPAAAVGLGLLAPALLPVGAGAQPAPRLPEALARELAAIARQPQPAGQRLASAALALEEAGWQADSLLLALPAGELQLRGARPRPLRLERISGGEAAGAAPWQAGALVGSPTALVADGRRWLRTLDAAGFPFAQLWLQPAAAASDTLGMELVLTPGPQGPLGDLRVLGGRRLHEDFLAAYADLPAREPLSRAAAARGRERLAATGWFLRVEEPLLGWDPVAARVGVLYRVQERPRPNRVTAVVGGGGGETSGALDLDIFSPFGRGHRWSASGEWLGSERSRVDLLLSAPRVLGSDLALDLAFGRVSQDSTYLSLEVQLDLRLLLAAGWEGIAGIGYERNLFGLGGGSEDDASSNRRRHRFGLAWRSLAVDQRPAQERRLRLVGDLLLKRSQLAGEAPSSRQFALSGEGRAGWRLRERSWLRVKGGGELLYAAQGGFNSAELYPLGGAKDLRGYSEDFFRGDRVGYLGGELGLGDPLEVFVFLDYGWGRWRRVDAPPVSFRGWGTGIGLLAPGPRGQLSLALALGESKRLGDLRVHLALDTGF